MSYIPIAALTQSSTNSQSGIPANTTKTYNQTNIGTSNTFTDYTSNLAPGGDFLKITGTSVFVNSIKNLLMTPTGSYIFDPTYGSDLYKKVFDPADEETVEDIKIEVIDKIKTYDNRIQITDVITEFFSNKKGFRVNVTIQSAVATEISVDITEDMGFSLEEGK